MKDLTTKSFEMRDLIRFNGRDKHLHENLAEHSFSIQMSLLDLLVMKFGSIGKVRDWDYFGDVMLYASIHDMYELVTGDILSPTKEMLRIKKRYDALDAKYITKHFGEFDGLVHKWVKAADNYTVWKWCEYVLQTSHNDTIYEICNTCKGSFEKIWEELQNANY